MKLADYSIAARNENGIGFKTYRGEIIKSGDAAPFLLEYEDNTEEKRKRSWMRKIPRDWKDFPHYGEVKTILMSDKIIMKKSMADTYPCIEVFYNSTEGDVRMFSINIYRQAGEDMLGTLKRFLQY